MSVKPILSSRNAATAISFAAFRTHGIVPPALSASKVSGRERYLSISGSSNVSCPISARFIGCKTSPNLPGYESAYAIGPFMSGRESCAITLPSMNSTIECIMLCG